jgi:hypothetical protein
MTTLSRPASPLITETPGLLAAISHAALALNPNLTQLQVTVAWACVQALFPKSEE